MSHDASFIASLSAAVEAEGPAERAASTRYRQGMSWRLLATGALLVVTLPVFAAAAVLCLPVLLVVRGAEGLRSLLALSPMLRQSLPR